MLLFLKHISDMKNSFTRVAIILLLGNQYFLSSCEKKQKTTEIIKTDSSTIIIEKESGGQLDRDKINQESEEVKMKLKALKEKVKGTGDKAGEKTSKEIDELENERKSFDTDSAKETMSDRWKAFKTKVQSKTDSLGK